MSCSGVQNLLGLFATGDLEAAERETVAAHLKACAKCAAEVGALQAAAASLQSGLKAWVAAGGIPEAAAARLEAAIQGQLRVAAPRPTRLRTLTLAAAAVAAVLILSAILSSRPLTGGTSVLGSLTQLFRSAVTTTETAVGEQVAQVSVAGVTLVVDAVTFTDAATVLRYRLQGLPEQLTASAQLESALAAELTLVDGTVISRRGVTLASTGVRGQAELTATFAAAPLGAGLRLSIAKLPAGTAGETISGPWRVNLPRRSGSGQENK